MCLLNPPRQRPRGRSMAPDVLSTPTTATAIREVSLLRQIPLDLQNCLPFPQTLSIRTFSPSPMLSNVCSAYNIFGGLVIPRQRIPIQRLKRLSKPFMAIVLLIPHILMINDFILPIQCQTNQTIHSFAFREEFGRVFLLQLEYYLFVI